MRSSASTLSILLLMSSAYESEAVANSQPSAPAEVISPAASSIVPRLEAQQTGDTSQASAGAMARWSTASQSFPTAVNASATEQTEVISSWAVVVLFNDAAELLKASGKGWLTSAFRNAVADSLSVCRTSVAVVEAQVSDIDVTYNPTDGFRFRRHDSTSLFQRLQHFVRIARPLEEEIQTVMTSEVRMVYQVRIFKEMRFSALEVARRIDGLQIYNKFTHLNRLLRNAVDAQAYGYGRMAHIDDIGHAEHFALGEVPSLPYSQVTDCVEEGFLNDARRTHTTVMFMAFLLVALITCTGSAVFTVKQPSIVPSRLNPIVNQ